MQQMNINTLCNFTFWISLSLRPKTETKWLKFSLSLELRLTNCRSTSYITSDDVTSDDVM